MGLNRVISTDDRRYVITDPISDVLADKLKLIDHGEPFACPIQDLVIDASLDGQERDLLGKIGLGRSLSIVCDANTYDVLGARIARALSSADVIISDAKAADEDAVEALMAKARHVSTLIAVGSGTINDIVKLASHRRGTAYAVFATAPSMNGYVTATASISRHGQKLSLPATPPIGAFFDLAILANAPMRLLRAGVGDSLCRSTAEFDWRLSHQLLETPFFEIPFTIQAADEADLLSRIGDLRNRDIDAVKTLTRLLILGGLGMLLTGNSQPGSQGEHLISHYIDMLSTTHQGSLHGEQVGLATWTMSALQHQMLDQESAPLLLETAIDAKALNDCFGPLSEACGQALRAKTPKGDHRDRLNRHLHDQWPACRSVLKERSLSHRRLREAFDIMEIKTDPEALGLSRAFYRDAVLQSRALRDRFTALDLAAMTGTLDAFIDNHLPFNR